MDSSRRRAARDKAGNLILSSDLRRMSPFETLDRRCYAVAAKHLSRRPASGRESDPLILTQLLERLAMAGCAS